MGCGGGIGDFFASFDDMVHNTVKGMIADAKFYISHPLEAVEVAALMYVGVPPVVAKSTVSYANGHGSIQQVGISVVQAYAGGQMGDTFAIEGVPPEMMNVITSASASAAVAAIQGKPLDQILKAGFAGSVQGLVINEFKGFAAENGVVFNPKDLDTQLITNAVNSATTAIINGKSIGDAIANSTASTLTTYGIKEVSTAIGDVWGEIYKNSETLQDIGNAYNELKGEATKTWEELTGNVKASENIYTGVKNMFDAATNFTNMTNRSVAAYEEAKFDSTHIDEFLVKVAPQQFRIRTGDDGEGGTYTRFEEKKSWTDDDGNPVWQGVDNDEFRFEGQTKDQLRAGRERLAEAHATNANSQATNAKIYSDAYVSQVTAYNNFVDNYITPVSNKFDTQSTKLKELEATAIDLSDKNEKLTVDLTDKFKTFEELKEKYGEELAQQIADEAAKTIKADQDAKAAEEEARIAKEKAEQDAEDAKAAEEAKLKAEEAERLRIAAEEAKKAEEDVRKKAEEVKPVAPVTPAGPQVGDMSDAAPGTKVTLADGTIGVVSNSGKIVPEGTVSDLTPVVNPTVTTGPVEPKDEEPTDVTPQPTDTDVIPDDAERQPDGTFLDPKTGVKYIVNDDGTVTTMFPKDAEPTIGPPGPGPDVLEPTTWTPPPNAVQNPDGSYTVTNDDGSTNTYSKDGDPVGSTDATDTTDPTIGPVVPGPDTPPVGPTNPDIDLDKPHEDDTGPEIVNEDPINPDIDLDKPHEDDTGPEIVNEEPPPESTPEQKYNFYLKKGVPEPSARIRSGFTPKVPPVTPVKPVTPAPVKPPITTLPPVTPLPPPVKPVTPAAPPVQYDNSWYMLASLLGAPDLAAQVYNKVPMQKGGLATLKPKKHGLASLTTQNRRSK